MKTGRRFIDGESVRHFLAGVAIAMAIATAFVVGLEAGIVITEGGSFDSSTAVIGVMGTLSTAGLSLTLRDSD